MPVTRAMSLLRPIEARGWGMAERLLIAARGKVPHHGPVTPECPVECLLTVLSLNSFNPLTRAYADGTADVGQPAPVPADGTAEGGEAEVGTAPGQTRR
jgi:hypothetical protein